MSAIRRVFDSSILPRIVGIQESIDSNVGNMKPLVTFVTVLSGLFLFAHLTQPLTLEDPVIPAEDTKSLGGNETSTINRRDSVDDISVLPFIFIFFFLCFSLIIQRFIWLRTTAQRNSRRPATSALAWIQQGLRGGRGLTSMDRIRLQLALSNRDFNGDDYDQLLMLDENRSSSVPRGADELQISRLPLHPHSAQTNSHVDGTHAVDTSRYCSICLGPFEEGEMIRTVICLHQFHSQCIDPWLRSHGTCPVCKYPAVE